MSSLAPDGLILWSKQGIKQEFVHVQSQFSLQDSIEQAMAHQARRSMRSFSVSSCSSMLSLLSSCPSIGSMSSLTSLGSSTDGFQKDVVHNGGVAELACSPAVSLGKQRQKQKPEKEAERRGRWQGANQAPSATFPHGSWVMQCDETPMGHGSYNCCTMRCTTHDPWRFNHWTTHDRWELIVHGPWVVQWYIISMHHELYNSILPHVS